MKIRIDNLPKVCNGYVFSKNKNEPIWTEEFRDWYSNNAIEQLKNMYIMRNLTHDCDMYVLEFYNAEDATIFSLQFC